MESPERICRFCFEKCDTNFRAIERSTHEILNMLLITMNLAISDEPVVCTNCAEILQNCFVFKKTCLDIRAHSVTFDSDKNNDPGICNFCMNPLNNCSFTLLGIEEDLISEKSILEKYFPELDVNASEIPVICEVCHGSLVNFISFITISSIVEDKIKEYREAKCLNNTDRIKLSNVLEFTSENVCREDNKLGVVKMEHAIEENYGPNYRQKYCETPDINNRGQMEISSSLQCTIRDVTTREVNGNSTDIVKIEQFCEDRENPDGIEIGKGGGIIKLEQIFFDDREDGNMEINNREVKSEPQFTLENIWACAGGSDNLGSIKTNDIFVEENETKYEEKFVEIENQTFEFNEKMETKTDKQDSDRTEDGVIVPHSVVATNLLESQKILMSNLEEGISKSYVKPTLTDKSVKKKIMYKCDYCSFHTDRKHSVTRHLLKHKDPSEITMQKCVYCSFQSKYKLSLEKHSLQHKDPSEVTMHKCGSCSYQTKYKAHLKRHLLQHKNFSDVTMYKCVSCSYQTKHKESLKKHLLQHEDPSEVIMYKCESCSFQTKYKRHLKVHLVQHKDPSEVTTYECEYCLYQTKQRRNLKRHLLKHKDPSEVTMYKCGSCSYQTKHKGYLKRHLLQHKDFSEVTMYKCESCSYQTKFKESLKKHLLQHEDPSEVTMYKCETCPFQTKYKRHLNVHLLLHKDPSEVTMYKCDYCSYQTKHRRYLKTHVLKHKDPSEVTMYECDYCSYQTKRKDNLKQHLLTHKT